MLAPHPSHGWGRLLGRVRVSSAARTAPLFGGFGVGQAEHVGNALPAPPLPAGLVDERGLGLVSHSPLNRYQPVPALHDLVPHLEPLGDREDLGGFERSPLPSNRRREPARHGSSAVPRPVEIDHQSRHLFV
jgi:hypothetical protein